MIQHQDWNSIKFTSAISNNNAKKVTFKKPLNISTNYESQISQSHRLSDSKYRLEEPFNITQKSSMLKTSIYTNLLPHVTVSECNYFIITVPTPVDKNNRPDLTPLLKASQTVAKVLKVIQ